MGVVGHGEMPRNVDKRVKVALESLALSGCGGADLGRHGQPDGGRRATRALHSAHPELTALMFANDFMALGAMREIRERGLRVPEDISVTGFDDVAFSQYWHPALTSVHIPRDQIGRMVCDALISDEKSRPGHETVIVPQLVLRDSTGSAAKS